MDYIFSAITKKSDMMLHFSLLADCVFLEKDEFRKLRNSGIDFLIEQNFEVIQTGIATEQVKIGIQMRLPIKEFWIVAWRDDIFLRNGWGQYTTLDDTKGRQGSYLVPLSMVYSDYTPTLFLQQYWLNYYVDQSYLPVYHIIREVELYLDNQVRIPRTESTYLSVATPYNWHMSFNEPSYLYQYSFSIEPREFQPSGILNLDRISKAELILYMTQFPPQKPLLNIGYTPFNLEPQPYMNKDWAYKFIVKVIFVNYNILRIKSGMADVLLRR